MDVGDVDHGAARGKQMRCRRLGQKKRRLQVAADEFIPRRQVDAPSGVGKKLEALFTSASRRPKRSTVAGDQCRQGFELPQVGLQTGRRRGSEGVQFGNQRRRRCAGA
jgi:hypothetical protein